MSTNQVNNEMNELKNELEELKKGGFLSNFLFGFKKLYFPAIARFLFILAWVIIALVGAAGCVFGLYTMITASFGMGLIFIIGVAVYVIMLIFMIRIWFELILVLFTINDAVQDIRKSCKK